MLTMVTVQRTEPHGMGQKLLEILRPAKVVERIETGAGREYRHIIVEAGRKDIPWKKVIRLIGGEPFILPREISIPPQVPLERFVPKKLQPKLALQMLLDCLKGSWIPPSSRIVGIIDPDGEYQAAAMALAEQASTVRILTGEPEKYKVFQRQMLDLYGAPILVGDNLSFLRDCMAVYCPAPYESGEEAAPRGLFFAARQMLDLYGAPILVGDNLSFLRDCMAVYCPAPYESGEEAAPRGLFFAAAPLCLQGRCQILEDFSPACPGDTIPKGIHPADFYGALYEWGGAKELEDSPAARADCKGRPNRLGELCEYLRRTFGVK